MTERHFHRAIAPFRAFGRGRDVMGVARKAVTHYFGVDLRAARLGVLHFFKHEDAGALAHHETVAVLVIGTRGLRRAVVEMRGQRAAAHKGGDAQTANRRLRAACNHHVRITPLNEAAGVANGVRARGAGRHHGVVRTLETVTDGNLTGGQIDQERGNHERADPARSAFLQLQRRVIDGLETANAGADQNTGAQTRFFILWRPVRVLDRLVGGRDCVEDKFIDPALLFRGKSLFRVENAGHVSRAAAAPVNARHLGRDLTGEVGRFEIFDFVGPGPPLKKARPSLFDARCERRDKAQSGNRNAAFHDRG